VTTSRATYDFPLLVPMRADVVASASLNTLVFRAFEALTEAFQVITYLEDPTWWHNVVIPAAILQLSTDSFGRRRVTPQLVEHVHAALDGAVFGDFGLAYGVDDEGQPGTARAGSATWYGSNSVVLSYATGVPVARPRDVGSYLVISTPGFLGSFQILGMSTDGLTLTLDRFPPPEASGLVPPVSLSVELPPLLYRRTVAFVMMDRFLKYNAIRLSIDKSVSLSPELLGDVTRLVNEAKPSHTYIYLDAMTDFVDEVRLSEVFSYAVGAELGDALYGVQNTLVYGPPGLARYGDAFNFVETSTTISGTPGTYTLPVVLPAGTSPVATLVKVRFDPAVMIGSRRPAEDVDYTVDYVAHTVTITSGSFPVGPNTVNYVYCARRLVTDSDVLTSGETRLCHAGSDPTVWRAATQGADQFGIIDRAVQITLGP
jgi:hypothetical protein